MDLKNFCGASRSPVVSDRGYSLEYLPVSARPWVVRFLSDGDIVRTESFDSVDDAESAGVDYLFGGVDA